MGWLELQAFFILLIKTLQFWAGMKPKSRPETSQLNLFQAQFEQLLNQDHPLFIMANKIDWNRFEVELADCYSPDMGALGKSIRLLVGLHYLKHTFNESDESVLDRWVDRTGNTSAVSPRCNTSFLSIQLR
jgi:hypothetical protein